MRRRHITEDPQGKATQGYRIQRVWERCARRARSSGSGRRRIAPSRRSVAKATGFPDEVAQVDDRLGTCTSLA